MTQPFLATAQNRQSNSLGLRHYIIERNQVVAI